MSRRRGKFVLTESAARDLTEIRGYVQPRSPAGWISLRTRLREAMRQLAQHPGLGHRREDLTGSDVRFFNVGSYVIAYISDTDPVEILRVLHSARDVGRYF